MGAVLFLLKQHTEPNGFGPRSDKFYPAYNNCAHHHRTLKNKAFLGGPGSSVHRLIAGIVHNSALFAKERMKRERIRTSLPDPPATGLPYPSPLLRSPPTSRIEDHSCSSLSFRRPAAPATASPPAAPQARCERWASHSRRLHFLQLAIPRAPLSLYQNQQAPSTAPATALTKAQPGATQR